MCCESSCSCMKERFYACVLCTYSRTVGFPTCLHSFLWVPGFMWQWGASFPLHCWPNSPILDVWHFLTHYLSICMVTWYQGQRFRAHLFFKNPSPPKALQVETEAWSLMIKKRYWAKDALEVISLICWLYWLCIDWWQLYWWDDVVYSVPNQTRGERFCFLSDEGNGCDKSTGFISPSNRSFFILVHTGDTNSKIQSREFF